jgi:hypothetical protein
MGNIETHSLSSSLAASRRGFAFCLADPNRLGCRLLICRCKKLTGLESIRAASLDFEARRLLRQSAHHRRVALRSPSQSLGEDAQAECQETPRKPRKRVCLTRSREKMDSALAGGFAPHPGDASGDGAIHQSSVDVTDVDRAGQRDVLERAKASAPLPLDRAGRRFLRFRERDFEVERQQEKFVIG